MKKPTRDKSNYPAYKPNHSVHHIAYPYSYYKGEIEHDRYQNNPALLQQIHNTRHNLGYLTIHSLIDPIYGAPPKPSRPLMLDAIDYMQALDPFESRIRKLGHVISFFMDEADDNPSYELSHQADLISVHYSMQHMIITQGGEAFMRSEMYKKHREAA